MKNISLFAVMAALAFGAATAGAKDLVYSKKAVKDLSTVPAAELPLAAAKVVMSAPADARTAATAAVIRKVSETKPAALRHVVAAIAKQDASLAPLAASLAAKAQPESVGSVVASACAAAPAKAPEVVAVCATTTSHSRSALSDMVVQFEPAFASSTLAQEAEAVDVSASAAVARGGTPILPVRTPGQVGVTMNGDAVTTPPTAIGPGRPGFDPDRYATGGN